MFDVLINHSKANFYVVRPALEIYVHLGYIFVDQIFWRSTARGIFICGLCYFAVCYPIWAALGYFSLPGVSQLHVNRPFSKISWPVYPAHRHFNHVAKAHSYSEAILFNVQGTFMLFQVKFIKVEGFEFNHIQIYNSKEKISTKHHGARRLSDTSISFLFLSLGQGALYMFGSMIHLFGFVS